MEKYEKNHIAWVDILRIVACFLVILSHSCDPFVAQFDNNRAEFLTGAFIGSFMRSCVPLFVMISGILLLPIKMEMTTFYSKRAKRIILPFVFWSLLLPVLYYLYFIIGGGVQTISPATNPENHTLLISLQKMYTFIFNFNYDTTPLWYLYMLFGLYLFMPIISAWLKQASKKDIKVFLFIWIISMCLPYIQMLAPVLGYTGNYGSMGILGVCDWNTYGTLYYFSGFLGYLVLGYYLVNYPLNWSLKRTLSVAIPIFLLGYAITSGGFILTQKYFPASYANLEIIWYFSGINVFMMTFAVFIVFQKIKISPSPLISKVASLTFGVYLCHFIFVQLGYDLVYTNVDIPAVFKILLIAAISFIISLFIVWLMSLSKVLSKVIM